MKKKKKNKKTFELFRYLTGHFSYCLFHIIMLSHWSEYVKYMEGK